MSIKKPREPKGAQVTQKTQQATQNDKLEQLMANFSMSKPTNVDAQRIITIIENLQAKLSILQYLDTEVMLILNDNGKKQEKSEILNAMSPKAVEMLEQESVLENHLRKIWQESILIISQLN